MTVAREPFVLLEDATPGHARVQMFKHPRAIIEAWDDDDVAPAFTALESALAEGRYVAGYFSYELGYLLEPWLRVLLPPQRTVPLLWFGVFTEREILEGDAADALYADSTTHAYAGPLRHDWDRETYARAFDHVHDWIAAGDIYQANLSFRSRFNFVGDPFALYRALRSQSCMAYGAYIEDGARSILSFSPELFFSLDTDGVLTARPMKGTAARGKDQAADDAARARLLASAKERAENLMIVDLLRNDLGRMAQMGSVAVKSLFAVETYPTLHTLVSTIAAAKKPEVSAVDVTRALFPCGSVTGAPKIRSMEIIRALEKSRRGVYCGAIGYFAPDGSAKFNVAIRTLTINDNCGELGIGGAVTYDSRMDSEYDECLLKARYYESARRPLKLIETLRWEDGDFVRLPRHLARMRNSATCFGIVFDETAAMKALQNVVADARAAMRVRLTLDEARAFDCTSAVLSETPPLWRFTISTQRVNSGDSLLQHKTTWRDLYDSELAKAARELGCDEVLFLNERGKLAEGSRSNIFVERNGLLLTPPLSAGCLPGCLRQQFLDDGKCAEVALTLADFETADAVYFGNSLRGLIRAQAV